MKRTSLVVQVRLVNVQRLLDSEAFHIQVREAL